MKRMLVHVCFFNFNEATVPFARTNLAAGGLLAPYHQIQFNVTEGINRRSSFILQELSKFHP
jgi:hypothetical protein